MRSTVTDGVHGYARLVRNCMASNTVNPAIHPGTRGDFYFLPMPVRHFGFRGTAEILVAACTEGFKRVDFDHMLKLHKARKFSIFRWFGSLGLGGKFIASQMIRIPYISIPALLGVKWWINSNLHPSINDLNDAKAQLTMEGFNIS